MRRPALLMAACALLFACAVFSMALAQAPRGKDHLVWEYRNVAMSEVVTPEQAMNPPEGIAALDKKFNELGQDGWEFAGELPGVALFKRQKR